MRRVLLTQPNARRGHSGQVGENASCMADYDGQDLYPCSRAHPVRSSARKRVLLCSFFLISPSVLNPGTQWGNTNAVSGDLAEVFPLPFVGSSSHLPGGEKFRGGGTDT